MFWRKLCPVHIFCIEWWLWLHINSFSNAFALLNDTILKDPGVYLIYNADYCKAASIYFILGQYAKLFCQIINELLILGTGIGTHN